jgi:hypothetical protein
MSMENKSKNKIADEKKLNSVKLLLKLSYRELSSKLFNYTNYQL